MKTVTVAVLAMAIAGGAFAQTTSAVPISPDEALREDGAAQAPLRYSMPDTPGTGAYPAMRGTDAAFPGHVIYRPRDLDAMARPLPVLLFGNGGCSADGAAARAFLGEIASHGYLVIAPGSQISGPGMTPPAPGASVGHTTVADVLAGMDQALAANETGLYRHRIDTDRIAVAGWSCGGLQALQVAADPRIRAVIGLHTGIFSDTRNPNTGQPIDKLQLLRLHTPVLYVLGGERDIAYLNGRDDVDRIAHVPAMMASHLVGHLGTFNQPNGGEEAQVAVDWLNWQLYGDAKAAKRFVGTDCALCRDPSWTILRKHIG
ncbi:MAG TPA: dienelactone hydrolase family protein [Caulobacteraceae bacterium]|nr:dienelactone hydrolase family protein [Caulobacteraceae bacterium]